MRLLAAALVCAASAGTTASAAVRVLRGHEFCEAAFRGDLKKMKMAILDGADVEYPCPSRSRETKSIRTVSALYIASQNGLAEMVKLLLSEGADGNAMYDGMSPLYTAARNDHGEVVRLLLAGQQKGKPAPEGLVAARYQNVALDGRDTSLDDAGPELRAEESHRRLVGPEEARTGRLAALL